MRIALPTATTLWETPNPEIMIERAGRVCYKSEEKITTTSARDFCTTLRKSGHHAMLEHASASFHVVTDRGISHEMVRHRIASYAQESTRYCNYSGQKFDKQCTYIEPPNLGKKAYAIWKRHCEQSEQDYFDMLDAGCTAQIARSVHPTCLKTEIIMTANFREWRHFIQLRGEFAAHPQIRPLAYALWLKLMGIAPSVFDDLTPLNEPL